MRLKTLILLPCLGLALLLSSSPAGAVERLHAAPGPGGVAGRAAAAAPASPADSAGTLALVVWTYLAEAGLVPPPPPTPTSSPIDDTPFSADSSDQGATLDPNGTP